MFTTDNIPEEFICPITKQIMITPVKFDCADKHCYEHEMALKYLDKQNIRTPLGVSIKVLLTKDSELKEKIEKFLKANPQYRSEIYISKSFITEINQALKNSDLQKIKQLVESNNNILFHRFIWGVDDPENGGNTIIHNACYAAQLEFLKIYLEILDSMDAAAKLSALLVPGLYNYNAVHCVCKSGNQKAFDLIINAFSDNKKALKRAILATDSIGQNALFMTCEHFHDKNSNPDQVRYILNKLICILGNKTQIAALAIDAKQMSAYSLAENAKFNLNIYIEQCLADRCPDHQHPTAFFAFRN